MTCVCDVSPAFKADLITHSVRCSTSPEHFDPTALEELVELLSHGCWTSARRTESICFAPLCSFSPLLCLNLSCFLYTSLWLETAAKHLRQHFKNECISDVSKLGAPSLSPFLPPFVWVCVMWVCVCVRAWVFFSILPLINVSKNGSGLKIVCSVAKFSTWLIALAKRMEKNRLGEAGWVSKALFIQKLVWRPLVNPCPWTTPPPPPDLGVPLNIWSSFI